MRRLAEITAFLGLSAAVHAGVMAGLGNSLGGPEGQGNGGADRVTLQAAPEGLQALADRWTTAPSLMEATVPVMPPDIPEAPQEIRADTASSSRFLPPTPLAPAMDMTPPPIQATPAPAPTRPESMAQPSVLAAPQIALPGAPGSLPDISPTARLASPLTAPDPLRPPRPDTASPTPPVNPDHAVAASPRPIARPASPPPSAAPAAPQPARIAQGAGGGATQGAAQASAAAASISNAQRQSLMSGWGAQIMARIERARPRVRGSGQVTLTLQIARSGQLAALSVSQSSGDAALDEAAISAVRRAGRFPAAPDGLTDASYGFSLPIRFR